MYFQKKAKSALEAKSNAGATQARWNDQPSFGANGDFSQSFGALPFIGIWYNRNVLYTATATMQNIAVKDRTEWNINKMKPDGDSQVSHTGR